MSYINVCNMVAFKTIIFKILLSLNTYLKIVLLYLCHQKVNIFNHILVLEEFFPVLYHSCMLELKENVIRR